MLPICECPFGFEDGHVVGYTAQSSRLELKYQFWNEHIGLLVFEGFVALHDNSAIGVTVGSASQANSSDLLNVIASRRFERPPQPLSWKHFQFLDLDDTPMLEIVAHSCSLSVQPLPEQQEGTSVVSDP
jgi:hypothetical protein